VPVTDRVVGQQALDRVTSELGSLVSDARINFDQIDVTCTPDNLVEVVGKLRQAPGIEARFFTFLSAVDRTAFGGEERPDEERGTPLEVLVHLYSPDHATHINIHVRECAEMFGIEFTGHPNLTNLYLPEDFEGNPLRKAFKLPTRMVKPWPGAKDPEEAAGGGRG
jgi:NADH:ubiquinone oxidoreductase subunit C